MEWEKVMIAFETGDKREGKDVNMGVEGSNSNVHGKDRDKEEHMMQLIEKLQKDAQAHLADSRKLMKIRDRQAEFNLKMLKSLERIEKKLEKGSGTRRSRSVRTPEGRRRSRSGNINYHLSPKHSGKETRSSSSPSPTKKHQKYGKEELKGEMNKIKHPTFDGEHKKEEDAETWLLGMKKYFQL
jgi:hypothetical protein